MKKTIYLANPYGFSKQQRAVLLPCIISKLEGMGLEVWEPFRRNNKVAFSDPDWPYVVANKNFSDVAEADSFFAVLNGCPPDEGVCVEVGMAIALRKPVFFFRDDIRRCTDNVKYPLNLMLFTGLSRDDWFKHYYSSIEDITDKDKALYKFASSGHEVSLLDV